MRGPPGFVKNPVHKAQHQTLVNLFSTWDEIIFLAIEFNTWKLKYKFFQLVSRLYVDNNFFLPNFDVQLISCNQ